MTPTPDPRPTGREAIAEELRRAFRRLRPQGSLGWNFADAYNRLDAQFGRARKQRDRAGSAVPAAPGPGTLARVVGRLSRLQAGAGSGELAPPAGQVGEPDERVAEAFDAVIEAFRFLVARVERLEAAAARRHEPIEGMAWLADGPDLGPMTGAIVTRMAEAGTPGTVVHAECGVGDLAASLSAAGIDALGVEPRGLLAWQAADRGVAVRVATTAEYLESVEPGSLGGMVLSGGIERLPTDELPELLRLAADRLAPRGLIVVVARRCHPAPIAADLLPPLLRPETWMLLLGRCGFESVTPLAPMPEAPAPGPDAPFALVGVRPER